MTILHGDDRIYNNIFVQHHPINKEYESAEHASYNVVGTAPFDIFPSYEEWIGQFDFTKDPDMGKLGEAHFGHLPVWVGGNSYFNGATICKHEKDYLEDKDNKVEISLTDKDGKLLLSTNLYSFLKDFKTGIISTECLGKAFEPEQRFENPDGTDIIFSKDYFGNDRGTATIPGPFAEGFDPKENLWHMNF